MWIIQSYKQHFCNVYFQAETEVTVTNSNAEVMDKLIVSGYDVKVRASGNGRLLLLLAYSFSFYILLLTDCSRTAL